MRQSALFAGLLSVGLAACAGSPPPPAPPPVVVAPEPIELSPPQAVPHDGPLVATPDVHDCGTVPEGLTCNVESVLRHRSDQVVIIGEVAQNVSAAAFVGLIDNRTAFDRDLPYTMPSSDRLRVVLDYRRDDPDEVIGGSMFVRYQHGGDDYVLEIPVQAR